MCECLHTLMNAMTFMIGKCERDTHTEGESVCVCLRDGEQEIGDGVKELALRRKSITHKYIYCIQIKCKQTDLEEKEGIDWLLITRV